MGPLAGIKVIEIAGLGPAPIAGMMLADMGAEVILIERATADGGAAQVVKDAFFMRGKKSIALNLKDPNAISVVLKLVAQADLLIEGFRPGVMERLGLGPDVCLDIKPELVYGRMTGWGQTGPLAHAAGHDPNYIGVSGASWYGGGAQRTPIAPITVVGDVGGGTMVLLFGLMCALTHAQKTGQGQIVDSAITDGSAYISSLLWMMRNTGQVQDELGQGWADWGSPWNNTYACSDGKFISICPLEPQFYADLMQRLGLTDNPVFASQWDQAQWPEGIKQLAALFLTKTRDQWCSELEGTDVCFGPVLNLTEAAQHPHNVARNTFITIDGVTQPAPAPKFSVTVPEVGAMPKTGQHTEEILASINDSN